MATKEKIKLVLINKKAMTFNADDYLKIRKDYRIIGKLIGVSPPYPRNVNLLNLPACFSDYETKLMIDENIAIVEHKQLTEAPSDEMKEAFKNHQQKISEELHNFHMKNKLEMTAQNMQQIIKGKRKKLIKSGVAENALITDINLRPEDILKEEEIKYRQTYNPQNLHTQVPTEYPFNCQVKELKEFPVSNIAKYKVFRDLWKKGFYLTNAENFGGDFLTYNGDPIYYHATQIVHIVTQSSMLEPHFLCSCARLSVSVKKKCLFAYLNNAESVVYQTLEWDNPKVKEMYDVVDEGNKSNASEDEECSEYV